MIRISRSNAFKIKTAEQKNYAKLFKNIGLTLNDKKIYTVQKMYIDCKSSIVETLKRQHVVSVEIPLNHKAFKDYDRVRVSEIKVLIRGYKTDSGWLQVMIQNEGMLFDRLNNEEFAFTGDTVAKIIQYKILKNKKIRSQVVGDINKNFERSFNSPTVFTTWNIKVLPENNPGLDLSHVTSIELLFSGNLMSYPKTSDEKKNQVENTVEISNKDNRIEP